MSVITVASRPAAICPSIRRRESASRCFWTSGCRELRMKKIQIASQGWITAQLTSTRRSKHLLALSRRRMQVFLDERLQGAENEEDPDCVPGMDHGSADQHAALVAGEGPFVERVDDRVGEKRVAAE